MFSLKSTVGMHATLTATYLVIMLAFTSALCPVLPFRAQQSAPATLADGGHKGKDFPSSEAQEEPGPPEGMTIQEWNRTAVKDPKHLLDGPQASPAPPKPTAEEKRGIFNAGQGVESVQDDPNSARVYPIRALINHATLIQVPSVVLKAWCGDLQGWTLEGESNYVSIKPLADNLSTNLHVLTTDGRMYNFRLYSNPSGAYTDVFQVKGGGAYQANVGHLVDERVADLKKTLDAEYEKKLQDAMAQAQLQWVRDYAGKTFFDYAIEEGRTFKVEGVFNDGTFTYFRVKGDEKPIIFLETRRGWKWVREVVNFNVTDGNFYRVQKILEPRQRFVLKLRHDEVTISRRGR